MPSPSDVPTLAQDQAIYERVSRMIALLPKGEETEVRIDPRAAPGTAYGVDGQLVIAPDVHFALMRHERLLMAAEHPQ